MNINLTPLELVYLYETLLTSSVSSSEQQDARQSIVSKARTSLLEKLEKISVDTNKTQFESWAANEAKKVQDLEKKNDELKSVAKKTAKKKLQRRK